MRQAQALKQSLCEVPAWEQFSATINLHDSLFNRASDIIDDGNKSVRVYGKTSNMRKPIAYSA